MKAKHKIILTLLLACALTALCLTLGACGNTGVEKLTLGNTESFFLVGEAFDGVEVQVTYADGTVENVKLGAEYVAGFDTAVAGKKTAVITYAGKTLKWEIEVSDLFVAAMAVKDGSADTFVQDGAYNDGDIVLIVTFTDGSSREAPVTADMIALSLKNVGETSAVIDYHGWKLTHTVAVRAAEVTSVAVSDLTKTRYRYGDAFDKVVLDVVYENGKTEVAEIADAAEITGFDTAAVGVQTLSLTYKDHPVSYEVEVLKKITALAVKDYTQYYAKDAAFDKATLALTYHDDTTEDVAVTAEMVRDFDTSSYGKHAVTVEYAELRTSYDVIVPFVTAVGDHKIQAEDKSLCDYSEAAGIKFESETTSGSSTIPNGAEGSSTANMSTVGNKIVIRFYSTAAGTFVFGTRAQSASGSGKKSQDLARVMALTVNGATVPVSGTLAAASTTGDNWAEMIHWTTLDVTGAIDVVVGENTIVLESLVGTGAERFPNFDYFTLNDYSVTDIAIGENANGLYLIGDEFAGVEVDVTHVTGKVETVTLGADCVSGFDTSSVGRKPVVITYAGKSLDWVIEVSEKSVAGIAVKDSSKKIFMSGSAYNDGDIVLLVTYGNTLVRDVPVTAAMLELDLTTPGERIATISYEGETAAYAVTVVTPLVTAHDTYKIQAEDENFCDYSAAVSTSSSGAKFENMTGQNNAEGASTANISKKGNKIIIRFYANVEGEFTFGLRAQSASSKGVKDQDLSKVLSVAVNGQAQAVTGTVIAGSANKQAWKNMNVWTELDDIAGACRMSVGENTIVLECLDHSDAGVRFPNFDYFTLTVN